MIIIIIIIIFKSIGGSQALAKVTKSFCTNSIYGSVAHQLSPHEIFDSF